VASSSPVDLTHFTLHRVLGKGGFGKVQVIESRRNGDYYALKSMDKQWLCTSSTNVKSVWLERHIMVQLRSAALYYRFGCRSGWTIGLLGMA
jgi:hypothetical protein